MKFTKLIAMFGMVAGIALAPTSTFAADPNDPDRIKIEDGSAFDEDGDSNNGIVEIKTSTTLKATNWYSLQDRVIVLNGATLTIEAGTVIASEQVGGVSGTLVIARDANIIAEGTKADPIIFTSFDHLCRWEVDANHPTGRNPDAQGTWVKGFAEWGSVAILGNARISDTRQNPNNPTAFDTLKQAPIEGLPTNLAGGASLYGGTDDEDDSGVFKYVQLSYGGDDFDPITNSELNGMSVGGVGRGTDYAFVEILNNIDDGLEIFGGTLNIKCLSVWNIGDDAFDCDQGWRGKAQFILITVGGAGDAPQGSGFGDNTFEIDGADGDSTAQPVTACQIWNATGIGAPSLDPFSGGAGDKGMVLRDNANVQWWNSVFMTYRDDVLAEDNAGKTVRVPGNDTDSVDNDSDSLTDEGADGVDNDTDSVTDEADESEGSFAAGGNDGDGSIGYGAGTAQGGAGSTLSFDARWTTPATWYHDPNNGFPNQGSAAAGDFVAAYTGQVESANLLQVSGTIFYAIDDWGSKITSVGVLPSTTVGSENASLDNLVAADSPIRHIERADFGEDPDFVPTGSGGDIGNVLTLDPRADNDALAQNRPMVFQPADDGFFTTPVGFRGAVGPDDWTQTWTAMSAMKNFYGEPILISPVPVAGSDPSDTALGLAVCISFTSVDGVVYKVVCLDDQGNDESVVAVVEGDGSVITITDLGNKPLDPCKKYVVRAEGTK